MFRVINVLNFILSGLLLILLVIFYITTSFKLGEWPSWIDWIFPLFLAVLLLVQWRVSRLAPSRWILFTISLLPSGIIFCFLYGYLVAITCAKSACVEMVVPVGIMALVGLVWLGLSLALIIKTRRRKTPGSSFVGHRGLWTAVGLVIILLAGARLGYVWLINAPNMVKVTKEGYQDSTQSIKEFLDHPTVELQEIVSTEDPTIACLVLSRDYSQSELKDWSREIERLQIFLIQRGLLKVQPTGYFGSLTQEALRSFQTKAELPPTGQVDSATREAVRRATCSLSSTEAYSTPLEFIFPNTGDVLSVGEGLFIIWRPGYITQAGEARSGRYDGYLVMPSGRSQKIFSGASRLGYFWEVEAPEGKGNYHLKLCLGGQNQCVTSGAFSIETTKRESLACATLPCFYKGRGYYNDEGYFDMPPSKTFATHPYQFDLKTDSLVKLVFKANMIGVESLSQQHLQLKLDGQPIPQVSIWVQDNDFWEVDLGKLLAGPHTLSFEPSKPNYFSLDWFRLLPLGPEVRYLDDSIK